MEQNACWDEPSVLDVTCEELFGTESHVLPTIVDHRKRGMVYSQWVHDDTHMACGSYGSRHIINLQSLLNGGEELDPRTDWLAFIKTYKHDDYDPITQGSSLQTQMRFAEKNGWTGGFYKVSTVQQAREAIAKNRFVYTGSGKIDRKKTKQSTDKVMVVGTGANHIICIIGYDDDKEWFIVRNSSGSQVYDKGHMYLRYSDLPNMFSLYAVLPSTDKTLKERIRANIKKKKETMVYEVRMNPITGKKKLARRPK